MKKKLKSLFWAYLQLLRGPNLFTVPGDVLAGYALAGGFVSGKFEWGSLYGLMLISLLLYSSGLLLNDYVDQEIDAKERPKRPIPSGIVASHTVLVLSIASMAIAFCLSWTFSWPVNFVVLLLIGSVITYNTLVKSIPYLAIAFMAICRGLNLLLGAVYSSEFASHHVMIGGGLLILVFYLLLVSMIAIHEQEHFPSISLIVSLSSFPLFLLFFGFHVLTSFQWLSLLLWLLLSINLLRLLWGLFRNIKISKTSMYVSALIRNLIFVQAVFVSLAPAAGWQYSLGLLLLWPLANLMGRTVYGS